MLRFISSVALVTGALLLADAAATLLWQEPVSAILAQHAQDQLAGRLEKVTKSAVRDKAAVAGDPDPRRRLAALAARFQARVQTGDPIGRIELPTLGRSYVMVEGTDADSLRKGPGRYPSTSFPGQPGTVAVAGHRTTYLAPFRPIDKLHRGDRIVLSMPYARFTYRVERTKIVDPTALWVTHRVGYDRLVLSACYPLYSAAKRIVVFARLTEAKPT